MSWVTFNWRTDNPIVYAVGRYYSYKDKTRRGCETISTREALEIEVTIVYQDETYIIYKKDDMYGVTRKFDISMYYVRNFNTIRNTGNIYYEACIKNQALELVSRVIYGKGLK